MCKRKTNWLIHLQNRLESKRGSQSERGCGQGRKFERAKESKLGSMRSREMERSKKREEEREGDRIVEKNGGRDATKREKMRVPKNKLKGIEAVTRIRREKRLEKNE